MPELNSRWIDGVIRKADHFTLIPSDPRYGEATITCRKKFGSKNVYDGMKGTFLVQFLNPECTQGKVVAIQTAAAPPLANEIPAVAPQEVKASAPFVHPYNFVSLPSDGLAHLPADSLFVRSAAADHSTYTKGRMSGRIHCRLTTLGPWFIPDPRKVHQQGEHTTLGYFTLDPVQPEIWGEKQAPTSDSGTPAIPAASLRGMIRSIYEAATLSCFSVLDRSPLDFRLGRDLEDQPYGTRLPRERKSARYLPCRFVSIDPSNTVIELLDGRHPTDNQKPIVLRTAMLHAYERSVRYRTESWDPSTERTGAATPIWKNLVTLSDGTPWTGNRVAAVIRVNPSTLLKPIDTRFVVRHVDCVIRADGESLSDSDLAILESAVNADKMQQRHVVFGYLHRTGPNIERKHHERIFFRWADFNTISPNANGKAKLAERFEQFQQTFRIDDVPGNADDVFLKVAQPVMESSLKHLKEYADRSPGKAAGTLESLHSRAPRMIGDLHHGGKTSRPPFPSDFVSPDRSKIRWDVADTAYALVEGDGPFAVVHGVYPVALPRLQHENSVGDLLPIDFRPCGSRHVDCCYKTSDRESTAEFCPECLNRHRHLCPACRVFGWTRDLTGTPQSGRSDRVDAIASHVRFSHGIYESGNVTATEVPLAILGSPKPTTTLFYLKKKKSSFEEARRARWPAALQVPRQPFYRKNEAQLRGRKFYRRRIGADPNSHNPVANGLKCQPGAPSSQYQTVHLLPKDLSFTFVVSFDNLTPEELGALLFSLSLQTPDSLQASGHIPREAQLCHAIGHGKPLGMGACRVSTTGLQIDSPAGDPADRYRCWNHETPAKQELQPFLDAFGEQWSATITAKPELRQTLVDLGEMLRYDWPTESSPPIHYPPDSRTGAFQENYRWFMQNVQLPKKGSASVGQFKELPEPARERDHPQCRLPVNPTNPQQ